MIQKQKIEIKEDRNKKVDDLGIKIKIKEDRNKKVDDFGIKIKIKEDRNLEKLTIQKLRQKLKNQELKKLMIQE